MGDQKYKQKHRELGLCIDCSEPVYRGHLCCLKHKRARNNRDVLYRLKNHSRERIADKKRKNKRRQEGCCTTCSAPLDPDADKDRSCCMNCRGGIHTERYIHGNLIV
jgi:hypothetical protein